LTEIVAACSAQTITKYDKCTQVFIFRAGGRYCDHCALKSWY